MTHEELVRVVGEMLERVVGEMLERIRDLEQQLAGLQGDPLEANHQAFLGRIREQEARGSE